MISKDGQRTNYPFSVEQPYWYGNFQIIKAHELTFMWQGPFKYSISAHTMLGEYIYFFAAIINYIIYLSEREIFYISPGSL